MLTNDAYPWLVHVRLPLPAEAFASGRSWAVWDLNLDLNDARELDYLFDYVKDLAIITSGRIRDRAIEIAVDLSYARGDASLQRKSVDSGGGLDRGAETIECLMRLTVDRAISGSIAPSLALKTLIWLLEVDEHALAGEDWLGIILTLRDEFPVEQAGSETALNESEVLNSLAPIKEFREFFPDNETNPK